MSRKLTRQSALENLKKEAKRWLDALRSGVVPARERLERASPNSPTSPTLRDVQHALALEHGLPGWTALRDALTRVTPVASPHSERVTSFLRNGSLDWRVGGSMRDSARRTAERLLIRHPEIARDSIFTAVVCGDLEEVERRLSERPAVASEKGGPRSWPPLLYLCSARLALPAVSDNAVAIARTLLARGADPNAFYPGGNESIHYTALTCVAGEGEEDAPPHPRREALWQLLLERGAEPYDMQTLYNTHFRGDVLWYLELMYAQALKVGRQADWNDPTWSMLDMGGYGCGAHYLLSVAMQKNDVELAEWILAHGASSNPPAPEHPSASKRTIVEEALRVGHSEVAQVLLRHGAAPSTAVYEGVEAFAAACFRLDRVDAQQMLSEHPEYLRDPVTMFAAAKRDRADIVAFLLDLGMSIEVEDAHGTRALHEAAYGDAPRVVSLLLASGAEVDPRERQHGNTPLGHAVYGKRRRIIELLSSVSRDIWELTWVGALERVRELLGAEPDLAKLISSDGHTPLMWLPDDDATAVEIARLFLANGADPSIQNKAGETAADRARMRGLDEVADLLHASPARSRLAQFEQLAKDLVAGYGPGETGALARLTEHFGREHTRDEVRNQVQQRIGTVNFGLTEAQSVVARLYGFGGWAELAESIVRPTTTAPRPAPVGQSSTPPFYRIDRMRNIIEPRPPLSDQDWETIFGVMKDTGITGLNAGAPMTDAVMARVARLDFITKLQLDGSRRLTDDGLLHISRMPQLQELELGGAITDRGLEVLRHLPELRQFQMTWARRISDAGVGHLARCDQIENVNLLGSSTGDGAINALRGKRHLRHFRTGRLVTDAGLPLLHDFPVFKTWQGGEQRYDLMSFGDAEPNFLMLDGPFSDKGVAALTGLDGIFGLGFFRHVSELTADGLRSLPELPKLGALGCEGTICNDTAMRQIASIPLLRMLMAQGTVASDDGFAALSKSQTIEYIWGRECPNLQGRGFAALAEMPALKGLGVSCKNVDDAALSALPRFPALRGLMPMDVSDDGFRHVGRCEQLENLWCMYCRDTGDAATEHLGGLPGLKFYYAGKTRITDRSLKILARMSSLEVLEFWEIAGITSAGVALLAGLPNLREISVAAPKVTREAMAVFPASVRVDYW